MAKDFKWPDYADYPAVKKQIHSYQQRAYHLYQIMKNAAPYIQYVYSQTQKNHLPAELALLPFVESNYDPFAYSHLGAVGLWQLMPGTASGFGLSIDWWYDGRRDIIASTQAALSYFKYFRRFFDGDWLHALAAYDSGEGTVQRAIRYNRRHQKPTDVWHLKLPRETDQYVPKVLALAAIIKNPEKYHIKLPFVSKRPYFEEVEIESQIDLFKLAEWAGVSSETLYSLNPGFRRRVIPPNGRYTLLVPQGHANQLLYNLKHLPDDQKTEWRERNVKAGHNLHTLAKQHKTTVLAIKQANQLRRSTITYDQSLLIPYGLSSLSSSSIKEVHKVIAADRLPGPKRVVHYAKENGESLHHVAKRFNVKASAIAFWNQISLGHKLKKGEKLILWKKHGHTAQIYKVKRGDSLSTIAKKHHMSVSEIKKKNALKSDVVKIGQKLKV